MSAHAELLRTLAGLNRNEVRARVDAAVVTAVRAGAAVDGADLVEVAWRGLTVPAARLASYTPAPGHVVLVVVQGTSLTILGRLIGTPPAEG